MEARRSYMPSNARYPIFLIGLLIIIVGGLIALRLDAPVNTDVAIAVVGFILLMISVVVR